MHRLVFVSEATSRLDDAGLSRLFYATRRAAETFEVTGLLLCHENRFFHGLEGEQAAVAAAFASLRTDRRYRNISVLEFAPADGRAFGRWRVGADCPEALDARVRDAAFSIFDLIPADAPLRGARPSVRAQVRRFLASFDSFGRQPA